MRYEVTIPSVRRVRGVVFDHSTQTVEIDTRELPDGFPVPDARYSHAFLPNVVGVVEFVTADYVWFRRLNVDTKFTCRSYWPVSRFQHFFRTV